MDEAYIRRIVQALANYHLGNDYVPLRISFGMRTPMAMGHPWLHLDGLLAHFVFRDAIENDYWNLPSKWPIPFSVQLPLRQTEDVWHGSVSVFENEAWTSTMIYKRFHSKGMEQMDAGRSSSIDIVRGHFKMMMMRLPIIPAQKVIFFANGDRNEITRLLSHVQFLGKKSAYGYGEVQSLEIAEIEEDRSVTTEHIAMRPIPITMLKKYSDIVRLAFRPPYWDKHNVSPCAPPGSKVVLK